MKKALLLTAFLMLGASIAFAQSGSVGIFADAAGTNCNLPDAVPGLTPYYVVHVYTTGATACQFKATKPACVLASYLSDATVFPVTVGNSQTGVSVGYGTCRSGPIHVLTLNFFTQGLTQACCYYKVACDPLGSDGCASGLIDIVDCSFEPALATAGTGIVKANGTCDCNVPVEDTTWGNVKALYGE
jgi:hypothetical protein